MDERKQAEAWRVLRIQAELVDGIEHLAKLGHAVSIYGSARLREDSPWYQQAETVGRMFSERGLAVITGEGQASWRRPTRVRSAVQPHR